MFHVVEIAESTYVTHLRLRGFLPHAQHPINPHTSAERSEIENFLIIVYATAT